MKKIIGYTLIAFTVTFYALWLFTDVINKNVNSQIFGGVIVMLPIIGIKLIKRK